MTAEHFDRTLQTYQRRKLFRSFRVQFVSGEHVDVDHPEPSSSAAASPSTSAPAACRRCSIMKA